MTFTVQHNDGDGWITGVREDLYDGTNDEVLENPAVFVRLGRCGRAK